MEENDEIDKDNKKEHSWGNRKRKMRSMREGKERWGKMERLKQRIENKRDEKMLIEEEK